VALVCAPPLLLIVTPGASSAVEAVAPDVVVVPVAVVVPVVVALLLIGVDPLVVDGDSVPAVEEAAGSVEDSPDEAVLDAELDEADESEAAPVVSAADTP
jgi:hypothetical protein